MLKKSQRNMITKATHGQGLVEYALLLALVSLVSVVVLNAMGDSVASTLEKTTCELGSGADCECRVLEDVVVSEYSCTAGNLFAYNAVTTCGEETELSLLSESSPSNVEYEMSYNASSELFEMTDSTTLCAELSSASPPQLYLVSRNSNYETTRSFPLGANGEPISGFGSESDVDGSSGSSGSGSSGSGSSGSGDSGSGSSGSGDSGSADSGSGDSGSGDSGSGDSGSGDSGSGDSGSGDSGSGDSGSGDSGSGDSGSGDSGSGDSGSSGGDIENTDPVIDPVTAQTVDENSSKTITFSATDADGDTLTYSSPTVLPVFMVLNEDLTVTPGSDDAGTYSVTITVSDGNGGSDSVTFDVIVEDVNTAPVLDAISDLSMTENETQAISLSATDAEGDTLTYGLSGTPPGFVTFNGSSSPSITVSPGFSDAGTYEIVAYVSDPSGESDTKTFNLVVSEANQDPFIASVEDQTIDEGATNTVMISASDADGDSLTLTATGTDESFMTFSASGDSATLDLAPEVEDSGTYTITIDANDGNGGTDSITFTVTVNDTLSANVISVVVGNGSSPSTSDNLLIAYLQNEGYTVNVFDDTANSSSVTASNPNLIIICESSISGQVNSKFRNTAIPVIVMEPLIYDDMKLSNTQGKDNDEDKVKIVDSSHPLAGGLSNGNKTIATSDGTFGYAEPDNDNVIIVATIDNDRDRATIFAYEAGSKMDDNVTAPARRVGFFAFDDVLQYLNADGAKLFEAAVVWAIGG